MQKINNKNIIKMILISIFVSFTLLLALNIVNEAEAGITEDTNALLKFIIKIEKSISKDIFKSIVVFGFTFFLLKQQKKENEGNNILKTILAILFSIFTIIGYVYIRTNNWKLIFYDGFQVFKALLMVTGYAILFRLMIDYVFDVLILNIRYRETDSKTFNLIFEKHSFIIPLAIILICWLPYLIAFYPGIIVTDSANQIRQFYGIGTIEGSSTDSVNLIDKNVKITNHHPVLHTVILGSLVKIGDFLGSTNFGIFLYTFLQFIFFAISLAYIISFMKKIKTNNYIRFFTLLIFALVPVFPFHAVEITKDIPFVSVIIFYIIVLYEIIKAENISKRNIVYIIFLSLLICLLRNNGIYTILLSLPFAALSNKQNRKKILLATLTVFIIYEAFTKIMLPILKVTNSGIREVLSIPFQQTARYVKEYGNEVTEKERKAIDKVLDYDTLAERYNPINSDYVKNKYNKDATGKDLKKYFRVWFKQFFKHPNVYVESFINNYYGYFYLESNPIGFGYGEISVENDCFSDTNIEYSYIQKFYEGREFIKHLININKRLPIESWVVNIGLNSWIIMGAAVYLLYNKKYKYIVYILPSLSILLVCCASPVNMYLRYALPNICAMPLILSILINISNNKENLNGKENSGNNTML